MWQMCIRDRNYCGYLNVNDMPDIEKFITDNDLGEFTGFTQRSGSANIRFICSM